MTNPVVGMPAPGAWAMSVAVKVTDEPEVMVVGLADTVIPGTAGFSVRASEPMFGAAVLAKETLPLKTAVITSAPMVGSSKAGKWARPSPLTSMAWSTPICTPLSKKLTVPVVGDAVALAPVPVTRADRVTS